MDLARLATKITPSAFHRDLSISPKTTVPQLADIIAFFEQFAPLTLAEDWDNVGLLLGNRRADVHSVLTCLTLTPDVAREAIDRRVNLVVSHHPILFKATKRITADAPEGAMLLDLAAAGVAVYSPHTCYDSAAGGINQQLAELLGLEQIEPLIGEETESTIGTGRKGIFPGSGDCRRPTLAEVLNLLKQKLNISTLAYTGDVNQAVSCVGIICGAGGEFLSVAKKCGCDLFLTGEARFHTALEARSLGISMILAGHYATERPAMEHLAKILSAEFPGVAISASEVERDPIQWS